MIFTGATYLKCVAYQLELNNPPKFCRAGYSVNQSLPVRNFFYTYICECIHELTINEVNTTCTYSQVTSTCKNPLDSYTSPSVCARNTAPVPPHS